jgi:hypothetical protein
MDESAEVPEGGKQISISARDGDSRLGLVVRRDDARRYRFEFRDSCDSSVPAAHREFLPEG